MRLGGWLNDVRHFSVSPTSLSIPSNQSRTTVVTFAPQFDTGILHMETQLTFVSDQSGGVSAIGLRGCVRVSC